MTFTIDSNVLVYGQQRDPERSATARAILDALAGTRVVLTIQALGEFLNVVRNKNAAALPQAMQEVRLWSLLFPCLSTQPQDLLVAAQLAERYRLQFWDSLILTVAAAGGVHVMLSEDMGDGATYNGVRVLNPFLSKNRATLDALLTPQS